MDKWVAGIFILVLILFLGFTIIDSQINMIGSSTPEIAAGCPVGQFATSENATGALNCGAQGAVSTEAAAGCAGAQQFFTTESVNGAVSCGIVTYGTCPANQFVTAVTTTTLNCGTQQAVSTEAVASCGTGLFATTELANGGFGTCGSDNLNFQSNSKSCALNSVTNEMTGFKLNYTIVGTGTVHVTIDFSIISNSTTINTFGLMFGTGTAPACGAATTGTLIGNNLAYVHVTTTLNTLTSENSVSGITSGLTVGTTYWFDLQAHEGGATHGKSVFELPQMSVIES